MPTVIPFQIGELVKHVAGGPAMAVCWVDELITCEWFNQLDQLEQHDFQPCLLIPAAIVKASAKLATL